MKLMTLMAAAALLAATHAIATRLTADNEDRALAQIGTRIHDLPAVRVYADPEVKREPRVDALQVALRVHDMPRVRVYAQAEELAFYRPTLARGNRLAVPRGSLRRGVRPIESAQQEARREQLAALATDCARPMLEGAKRQDCRSSQADGEGYVALGRGGLAAGR